MSHTALTPETREILRNEIIVIAHNASPQAVTMRILEVYLRPLGLNQSRQELEQQLAYLVDKGLLRSVSKTLSPENRAWEITSNGTDYFAINRLA